VHNLRCSKTGYINKECHLVLHDFSLLQLHIIEAGEKKTLAVTDIAAEFVAAFVPAETLARMFDQEFADKKPSPAIRYADFVVSGLGPDDDTVDAPAKIKRFKKEEFPQILVSVNMLDTGFDCPEVRNLVMACFTHSSILYQQMRGRGTRLSPGKERFTIWDITGVTLRHGDDEAPAEGGVVVVREPARPRARVRRLLTLDVHDEIDPATREWVTVDEAGHAFLDVDETHAQALGAAFETWLNGQKFNSDQLRLLHPVPYAPRPEISRGSAVRWRMLLHRPVDSVDPPKVERIKNEGRLTRARLQLLAHFRGTRMFAPVLLTVMCGLRRGEITALLWGSVDPARGQLSVAESTEQTAKGTRLKETKSGRPRTVAIPSLVIEELRSRPVHQAGELLTLGVPLNDQTFVVAQEDGRPLQPNSLTHEFVRILGKASALPCVRFRDLRHTHATHLLATGFIRRSRKSASGIRPLASRLTCTAMSCQECRRTRPQRLTPRSGQP
jgi:integrase